VPYSGERLFGPVRMVEDTYTRMVDRVFACAQGKTIGIARFARALMRPKAGSGCSVATGNAGGGAGGGHVRMEGACAAPRTVPYGQRKVGLVGD